MEFGLLGPLLVRANGREVDVASAKHRTILAALLLNAGRVVPADRLARAVWSDDDVPGNPRRALQLHIVRLRQILAEAEPRPIIRTVPDGYLIDHLGDEFDLNRFEYWRRVAHHAGDTDLDKKTAGLAEALAQWRGEPLADVPSEVLLREWGPSLREQRLQTLEQWVDLELERGHPDRVLGSLIDLTSREPLRESFWAQLLTALYLLDRRSEALYAYHTMRRLLAEELGTEPDEKLRDLHAAMLVDIDPMAADQITATAVRTLPTVAVAPAGAVREEHLAELDDLLIRLENGEAAGPMIVTVAGAAGVGKSALVLQWAHRVTDRFPDGQLWYDLSSPAGTPPLPRLLEAFGISGKQMPADAESQAALLRSLTDGRRLLIVLDHADSAEQVRSLLPGSPGCLVVIISRAPMPGLVAAEGAYPLMVSRLPQRA